VVGSFLLGAGWALIVERFGPTLVLWPLFATGFCGAFTTMSALAVEVDLKVRAGDPWAGVGYAGASVVAGLAGVVAGAGLTRRRGGREGVGGRGTFARRRQPWS
jgi:CrcB protein